MDLDRLYKILNETTIQIRKGDVVHGTPELVEAIKRGDEKLPGGVVSIDMMPSDKEVKPELERVDMQFLTIGVHREIAEEHRSEFIGLLNDYPQADRLTAGPSYIEVGGEIGDQGAAFQLFALGKVLGLWDVITPATLGFSGEQATQLAGIGYIMISGYTPTAKAA